MSLPKNIVGYLAPEDFTQLVQAELKDVVKTYDRLILAKGDIQESYWSQNIWKNLQVLPFESIKDAANKLKELGKLWQLYPLSAHRRAALIQEQLPKIRSKPLTFPHKFPSQLPPLGSWALLDEHTLIAASDCSSPFPNGDIEFVQDREGPPSRAYLKLWEAFTRLQKWPQKSDYCIELGASPGGWTWVLEKLGAQTLAVDRSPLIPELMKSSLVEFKKGDAFSVQPKDFQKVDWLFSDLACYPEKLLEYVHTWLASNKCRNFVCTLKFQGDTHYSAIQEFTKIPGSQLLHLTHNKHELTWIKVQD